MEENNKIIAEFLGWEKIYSEGYVEYILPKSLADPIYKLDSRFILEFDTDWNWLMAVVEKIENIKIKDYSISTDITDDKTFISVWHYGDGNKWSILISNYNEKYKDFNKIQRTYKAIIEFINFYNKRKEE